MFFSTGTDQQFSVGEQVSVQLKQFQVSDESLIEVILTQTMTSYSRNFTIPSAKEGRIQVHSAGGAYYVDNFRVVEAGTIGSSAAPNLANPSLETTFLPWTISIQGIGASADDEPIPTSLKAYGQYQIDLQVFDSDGATSLRVSKPIVHQSCDGGA